MDMEVEYEEAQHETQENTVEIRDRLYGYDYETDADSIGEMEFGIDSDEDEEGQDNLGDLQRLYEEATEMIRTNQPPSEGWYDNRYKYIYKYSHLNWDEMASRFRNKDLLIYDLCVQTKLHIQDILDGYSGVPNFDFNIYYTIICNILKLWNYYSNKYVGDESDTDLVDLAEALSFLTT